MGTTSAEKLQKVDLLSKSSGSARSKPAGVHYTGVYVSMVIPSLVVGTVGGGTALATQKECLAMMGCYGQVMSTLSIINPRCACAERVTVVVLCVCVYVCLSRTRYSGSTRD